MMFKWYCTYEKGSGGPWSDPDYERCTAKSRVMWDTKAKAYKAGCAHHARTGHRIKTEPVIRIKARRIKRVKRGHKK